MRRSTEPMVFVARLLLAMFVLLSADLVTAQTRPLQSEAGQAFANGDYLRAIELSRSALRSADYSGEYYCILGLSYFYLDRHQEAETYLKQTNALVRGLPIYKSTAKLYLTHILSQRYLDRPSSEARGALWTAVNDFLDYDEPTLLPEPTDSDARIRLREMVADFNDISGTWRGNSVLLQNQRFSITELSENRFQVNMVGSLGTLRDGGTAFSLAGPITRRGVQYSGTLLHKVLINVPNFVGEQRVNVQLRLSDDGGVLTGTAIYGPLTTFGDPAARSVYTRFLASKTVTFTLNRIE